jgi:hypothetical protein
MVKLVLITIVFMGLLLTNKHHGGGSNFLWKMGIQSIQTWKIGTLAYLGTTKMVTGYYLNCYCHRLISWKFADPQSTLCV